MKIIKREIYLERIRPFYDSNYIKVITGIRRCGKSEIMKQIINEIKKSGVKKSSIIYLDLETTTGSKITNRIQLEEYIDNLITKNSKYYIFIDEIQHIKNFEEAIASIRASYDCSLFVTGSNSKLLQGKMRDRLTGRAKEFTIYPFSYSEVLKFKKLNKLNFNEDDFYDYLKFGGMPQRFEEIDEDGIRQYTESLVLSIIDKDVFGNHKRINKRAFKTVSDYIIGSSGHLFSAISVAKFLKNELNNPDIKSSSATINNYADYMQESFFIAECLPYFVKGKQALKGTRKFYAIDPSLKTVFNKNLEFDDTFALETVVYNELVVRGFNVNYGKVRDKEIDFVVSKGSKRCYIQVTHSINSEKVFNREFSPLESVGDGCPKYVLSLDKIDKSYNGIIHINIIEFLKNVVNLQIS